MDNKDVNSSNGSRLIPDGIETTYKSDKYVAIEDSSQGGDNSTGDVSVDPNLDDPSSYKAEDITGGSSSVQTHENPSSYHDDDSTGGMLNFLTHASAIGDAGYSTPDFQQIRSRFSPGGLLFGSQRITATNTSNSYRETELFPPNPYADVSDAARGQPTFHRLAGSDHTFNDDPFSSQHSRYQPLSGPPDPPPFSVYPPLPDLTSQLDPHGMLSRRKGAINSYTAPDTFVDDFPYQPAIVASHLSAGEKPIHCNYTHLVLGTIKCDECGLKARSGGVYKCKDCLSQICTDCIEAQISQCTNDTNHFFTWKGTKLHGAFKPAYTQRKLLPTTPAIWKGKVTFKSSSSSSHHEAEHEAFVVIEHPSAAPKPDPKDRPLKRKRAEINSDEEIIAPSKAKKDSSAGGEEAEEASSNLSKAVMGRKSKLFEKLQGIKERAKKGGE